MRQQQWHITAHIKRPAVFKEMFVDSE